MTAYFVDTSGLAKRYVSEQGSSWVRSWITSTSNNVIVISELTYTEIKSVFARRRRDNSLSVSAAMQLSTDFISHYEHTDYLHILVDTSMIKVAALLIDAHQLRTLDAIQLACAKKALELLHEPITFVSADTNLLAAAAAEGFAIDNPNNHP